MAEILTKDQVAPLVRIYYDIQRDWYVLLKEDGAEFVLTGQSLSALEHFLKGEHG